MRVYYEAVEDNVPMGQDAEMVRVDVTDNTPEERADIKGAIADLMAGKAYHLQAHICFHDAGFPCALEALQ